MRVNIALMIPNMEREPGKEVLIFLGLNYKALISKKSGV
jgi:hypothetical protein